MDVDMNSDCLLYRRQFVLSDRPVTDLPGWKSILFGSMHFTVHPDLETTVARGSGELLLLGFVLSHRRPDASNQELLDELAGTCCDVDQMLEYCRDLCGRYVIAFSLSGKTGLLNDLIGSRSVYYCTHQGAIWCASQPSTLARLLEIDEDRSPGVQAFFSRDLYASGEAVWTGDGTKYVGIKHLTPNHYLDLEAKKAFRYWPTRPPGTLDLESAAQQSAAILQSTMRAATNRFRLSVAVTSGWDSRCVLAATRPMHSTLDYYVQKFGGMTDRHPDVWVPRRLARKLGFPFRVIECGDYQDDAFDAALEKNVFALQSPAKKTLYRSFAKDFQSEVNASGNASELGQNWYLNVMGAGAAALDVAGLLATEGIPQSEYASASLQDWYAEAKARCDALGYCLPELFYWEQRMGNWGSMFPAELDIAFDEFCPFATRRLIETMLAVDAELRVYHNSSVHRRIIELLWPELLSEPFNPVGWRAAVVLWLRRRGRRARTRLGSLPPVKALRSRMRGR
jgi:hypothetical protein